MPCKIIYCFTLYQDTLLCPFCDPAALFHDLVPAAFVRGCRSESRALAVFCNGLVTWECPCVLPLLWISWLAGVLPLGRCLFHDSSETWPRRLVPFHCTAFKVKCVLIFGDFAGLVKSHLCRKLKSPCFLSLVGRDSNCHLSGGHSHGVTRDL